MNLWIVGKINTENYKEWEFQGIFDCGDVAVSVCEDETWFVGPVTLNEKIPSKSAVWPNAYYPK